MPEKGHVAFIHRLGSQTITFSMVQSLTHEVHPDAGSLAPRPLGKQVGRRCLLLLTPEQTSPLKIVVNRLSAFDMLLQ